MARIGRIVKLYKKPSRQRSAPNRVTFATCKRWPELVTKISLSRRLRGSRESSLSVPWLDSVYFSESVMEGGSPTSLDDPALPIFRLCLLLHQRPKACEAVWSTRSLMVLLPINIGRAQVDCRSAIRFMCRSSPGSRGLRGALTVLCLEFSRKAPFLKDLSSGGEICLVLL